jgi:hypothetical protein
MKFMKQLHVLGKGANPNCSPQWPPIGLKKIWRGEVFTLNFKKWEGYHAYCRHKILSFFKE